MNVIIVGAGIGGLVTALQLARRGLPCVVYEQAEEIRESGGGITVSPDAVGELAQLGLPPDLLEVGTTLATTYATCLTTTTDPFDGFSAYERTA